MRVMIESMMGGCISLRSVCSLTGIGIKADRLDECSH